MITGGDLRQSRLDIGYKTFTISPWVVKVLKETDGDDFALAKAINAFKFMSSDMLTESFKVNPDVHVNTKSNLNSEVFMEIAYKIGINGDFFESYIHIIDSVLLKNRNAIAHGENTSVSAQPSPHMSEAWRGF
ncbi:hypothetical protein GCM10027295_18640 [Pseudaeromonas pectinilytica]